MTNKFSRHHASAALRWLNSMCDKRAWNLRVSEQRILLGGIKPHTYLKWRRLALRGEPVDVPHDTMARLSALLGIYTALKMIAPKERPELALRWFGTPISTDPFCGRSPKQYAISVGSIHALYFIRRYFESASYG